MRKVFFRLSEEDCPYDSKKTTLSYVNSKMNTKSSNVSNMQTCAIANKKLIKVLIIILENELLQTRGGMMTNVIVGILVGTKGSSGRQPEGHF